MKNKAFFFSTDAIISLLIIFITVLAVYLIVPTFRPESGVSSDVILVLSSLKMYEINSSYVSELISGGKIKNLNNSVLDQIGEFYITNITDAKLLAKDVLSGINPSQNLGIWYGSDLLFSVNSTPIESAKNVDVDKAVISGIEKGKITTGYIAKAWLKKIDEKSSTLFVKGDLICGGWTQYSWGYYCGVVPNNVTYQVDVPLNATITNAQWVAEGAWIGQQASFYINNTLIYSGSLVYYQIINITTYLKPGKNILVMSSSQGGDDGASHVSATYKTPDMQTFQFQNDFPFNEVISTEPLHYERSIFLSGEISLINLSINSSKAVSLSIRKGSSVIYIGKKSPVNNFVFFSDSEIKSKLSSAGIPYSSLNDEYLFFILDIGSPSSSTIKIGKNSNVYIESSETSMPYGTIDISQQIPIKKYSNQEEETFYRNLVWNFFLPLNSIPILTDWQFGWVHMSGNPGQNASANSIPLHTSPPQPYLEAFSRFGYSPALSPGVFKNGENNFTLDFGSGYGVSYEDSYGFLIYLIKNYVDYGDVFDKASGGTRVVQFEDSSVKSITIGNSSDPWDPSKDAIDNAVERLLQQLDANNNSKIDLIIDQDSFNIDSLDISGVPYLWETEVQVRTWD